jgi:uncharacterized protein (DUF342 family)
MSKIYTLTLTEDEVTSISNSLHTSIDIATNEWRNATGPKQEFYSKIRDRLEPLRDKLEALIKEDVSDEGEEEEEDNDDDE